MLATGRAVSGTQSQIPEDNLISAARQGDVDAFGVLFEMHRDSVYAFVFRSVMNREEAEDIVQETFCRAWKYISSFRGDSKLLTWLYRIAVNLCADYGRSPVRRTVSETDAGVDTHDLASLEQRRDAAEDYCTHQAVESALAKLPVSHRMLIVLCDIQGMTDSEAAKVVGCSAISVRVRLSRARKRLRDMLSSVLDEVE